MTAGWRDVAETTIQRWWARRGLPARLLWPLSLLFGAVLQARRVLLRLGAIQSHEVGVPVIVVGNRIVGGAGKTPTVIAIVRHLVERGWTPGVISRGHGRSADQPFQAVEADSPATATGDEPRLIHRATGVPVWVGRHRVDAARALRQANPSVDVIVSDDGLQHWAMARHVEVIVWDARGAGNGWLLPAGPLREPVDAPSVCGTPLVLYTQGRVSTSAPGWLARRAVTRVMPFEDWHRGAPGSRPLSSLRGERVDAYAGIANPESFFSALREGGLEVVPHPLQDHHPLTPVPWPASGRQVVVTEKDAVKLVPSPAGAKDSPQTRVWVAPLDFTPEPAFYDALDQQLSALPRRHGHPTR